MKEKNLFIFGLISATIISCNRIEAVTLSTNEVKLLQLAEQRFANSLSAPEVLLVDNAAKGAGGLLYRTTSDKDSDPANSLNWSTNRIIRGDLLAWLCTDPQAATLVSYQGIQLQGFRIDGQVNLTFSHIPFQLTAIDCAFTGDIRLDRCHVPAFTLVRCYFKNLEARGAEINGNVLLRDGCKADGVVRFAFAVVDGSFDCQGSHFINTNGAALDCDGIKIGRDLNLSEGFNAQTGRTG
ncbi:MAG: hypothetical protein ACLPRE_01840 [Limisphaerales bacterium]